MMNEVYNCLSRYWKFHHDSVSCWLTFRQITYLEEYYLTNSEIQVLRRSARAIAKAIPSGSMVIELGSGNLRKVQILLQALEDAGKDIDYYALDLDKQELERTLAQVPAFKSVRCHGLHGTYDDGREWLKQPSISARPKCVMSLGSSIGQFTQNAKFFQYEAVDLEQAIFTAMRQRRSCEASQTCCNLQIHSC
jgi:uncharacterized SAM-dependent methyltransferase